ncbi:60S large subunit ribosomal protein eL27 (rpL27) [Andalucia godoyi]|uniref:60S ribosomal protein L27 n=1 Tax=Andalucia godoyi TaxID=505711 RepID=A0A8K0AIF1_ANDGO|nr:60S large subunit ribosomal protein eL27 (rpL27) [Andalucia godoyi]|eukprot:ANDGO_07922.mRNA.1 60S large subunit ribosomal protein eL27 (rpL27)
MVRFIKPGRAVVLLQGRHAGQKAVVIRNVDKGSKDRPYGFAVVAGVERAPRAVTKSMNKRTVSRRSTLKPFLKAVNYNHMLPTRYTLEAELNDFVKVETVANKEAKKGALKKIGKVFKGRYLEGKNSWFFSKLRF